MNRNVLLRALVLTPLLLAGAWIVAPRLIAQEGDAKRSEDGAGEEAFEAEQPNEHHAALAREVGTWDATFRTPTGVSFEAVETKTMLGPFWLVSRFEGEMMGYPFVGSEQIGWDASRQAYAATWIDTTASTLAVLEGQATDDLSERTMRWTGPKWDGSGPTSYVSEHTWKDDDHRRYVQWELAADGTRTELMSVDYTRRK